MSDLLKYVLSAFVVIVLGSCNQTKQLTSQRMHSSAETWVVTVPDTTEISVLSSSSVMSNEIVLKDDEPINANENIARKPKRGSDEEFSRKGDMSLYHSRRNTKSFIKLPILGKSFGVSAKDDSTYQWSSITLALSLLLGVTAAAFGGVVLYGAAGAFGLLSCILAYMYWLEQSNDHAWYTTLFLMLAGLVAGIGFLFVLF